MAPLTGVRVLDFSTLLPGPLATLLLAEAGADVIKIERPGGGDEMRGYVPRFGAESVNFAMLNRGKRSLAVDLKDPGDHARVLSLIAVADVVVEQFRPGVMERLGLGYDVVSRLNPRLIYCSISGYGASGPQAQTAGHDLNYLAERGMLGLAAGADGAPPLPPALIADIGGGTYPAVVNILLALRQRDATGGGCHIDVAMADNLFTFMYWAIGNGLGADAWPRPGGELVTGGSPRYQVYRTADGRHVAAAPLEDKFWRTLCDLIGLDQALRDDGRDPEATRRAVAALIGARTAAEWRERFDGQEVCCNIVLTAEEAVAARRRHDELFAAVVTEPGGRQMPALPLPLAASLRQPRAQGTAPALGEANADFGFPSA